MKIIKTIILGLALFFLVIFVCLIISSKFSFKQEDRWDWNNINITNIEFPKNFIWGTADSAFQTEGIETANGNSIENSWTAWEKEEINEKNSFLSFKEIFIKLGILQPKKHPRTPPEKRAGTACNRWTHYKEDIQLLKKLGMNAHRFSIDWSKIEPQQAHYDYEALQHYIDYTQEMIKNDIQPIVTLFHHTLPLWFVKKGAFEKSENIKDFVEFSRFIFLEFQKAGLLEKTKLWLTLNEPIGFAFAAYVMGNLPPGKKFHLTLAGIVAKNLLDAHCAIYDIFKIIDSSVQISFAHAMNPIHPYHPWNPLDFFPAQIFDYLVNDVALEYFKTGNFYWLKTNFNDYFGTGFSLNFYTKQHNPNAQGKLDFIGVNYYTHTLLKMFHEASRPQEILADGYAGKKIKAIYPEGFYESIKKASMLKIPILITENGFATTSDTKRTEYLMKHLYVLYKALQDRFDIKGYLFWTLLDCFGWDSGQNSIHGLYSVDKTTQQRTLKSNASYLINTIKTKTIGKN